MAESATEIANAPRRSSRISAQVRPEAPTKRSRKAPSAAARGTAKSTKAGSSRKRALKEDLEGDQDVEREKDAKKVKVPSAEDTQSAGDVPGEESSTAAEPPSLPSDVLNNIEVGESLPSLVLKNERGEDVDTASLATEKGVVLFLVPKADTPGCTVQACGFRDVWEEFGTFNYDVYCLSADSPAAQTKWQTKKHLPYQLLSDPQRTLIGALGAADGNKTKRSHFVFDKGGKLLDKRIPVKPADSPRLALEFIKGLGN